MKKAAEVIAAGKVFACDVGLFDEDVFVYIAAFGIFTEVSYGTPQENEKYAWSYGIYFGGREAFAEY